MAIWPNKPHLQKWRRGALTEIKQVGKSQRKHPVIFRTLPGRNGGMKVRRRRENEARGGEILKNKERKTRWRWCQDGSTQYTEKEKKGETGE